MGRVFLVELGGRAYRCRSCNSHLALADDLLSKLPPGKGIPFQQCFLYDISSLLLRVPWKFGVNITVGAEEERLMLSGMHTVEDIFCCCCGQILGWKYVASHDKNQKYKEGKFVLERWRIMEEVADDFSLEAHPGSSDTENA